MKDPIDLEPLFPNRASDEPLGAQLVRRLRAAVESGFFPAASRLLPSRELALRLGVSRNTVTAALDQLIAEGISIPASAPARSSPQRFTARAAGPRQLREVYPPGHATSQQLAGSWMRWDRLLGRCAWARRILRRFRCGRRHRIERRNIAFADSHLDYGDGAGLPALREAISRHIAQFRGVVADPDQIIVVEGAQAALHLVAIVLTRSGERVAIEDPCYQFARAIFAANGLLLHGVTVDRDGIRTGELPREASLAYVTPSHQFPLGGAMPLARRTGILEWAQACNAYVVEDDYDSEFDAHPLPALQSLDRDERVIYVGTLARRSRRACVWATSLRHDTSRPRFASRAPYESWRVRSPAKDRRRLPLTRLFQPARPPHDGDLRTSPAHFGRDACKETAARLHDRSGATGLHVAIIGPADFDDVRADNNLPEGNRVLPLSLLCVQRKDCKGFLVGFSAGSDESIARAAAMLADSLASGS